MILSIIIVNYKTPDLLVRCIDSIIQSISVELLYEIIVIDNNSCDESEELIKASHKEVIWIQKNENDGFGRANNIGINNSKGEYVLLLNSDMIILNGSVERCLNRIAEDSTIGALGCKIINEDRSFQKSTYSIANLRQMLDLNLVFNKLFKPREEKQEAIMGSFMLLPKTVLQKCGQFDPDFFMYSEELELCNRILKEGFQVVYFDDVEAIHRHGGSIKNKNWALKQRYLSNALSYLQVIGIGGYLLYHIIFCLNGMTNFFSMWLLDKEYWKEFFIIQRGYFSNFFLYVMIPLCYKWRLGDGKRLLRAN